MDAFGCKTAVYKISQAYTQCKGKDDTGMTDDYRIFGFVFKNLQVQLHTDHEHEEDKTDLAEELQVGQRFFREQERGVFREIMPQE